MPSVPTHLKLRYDFILNGVVLTAGTLVRVIEVRSRPFYPEYLIEAFSDAQLLGRAWLPDYMVEKIKPSELIQRLQRDQRMLPTLNRTIDYST